HLMDRVEATAEQSGLRAAAVEWDAEREHLAGVDQLARRDDVLRRDVIERADLVVLAPAAPVRELLGGFLDRLAAHCDIHRLFLVYFGAQRCADPSTSLRIVPNGVKSGKDTNARF